MYPLENISRKPLQKPVKLDVERWVRAATTKYLSEQIIFENQANDIALKLANQTPTKMTNTLELSKYKERGAESSFKDYFVAILTKCYNLAWEGWKTVTT